MDNRLDQQRSAVIPASGTVAIEIGPTSLLQLWNVTSVSVSVALGAGNTKPDPSEAIITVLGNQQGGSYTGSLDSSPCNITLDNGTIRATWTGGTPGNVATLAVQGVILSKRG